MRVQLFDVDLSFYEGLQSFYRCALEGDAVSQSRPACRNLLAPRAFVDGGVVQVLQPCLNYVCT